MVVVIYLSPLGVLAAVLGGATTLSIRATRLSVASAENALFYQLAVSGIALAAGAVATSAKPWPTNLSSLAWGSLLFQAVVVSFASYLVWVWLTATTRRTRLASFSLLTPACGLLLGVLLLGEPVTTRLVVALLTVAAGTYIVNRKPRLPNSGANPGDKWTRRITVDERQRAGIAAPASDATGFLEAFDVVVAALHIQLRIDALQQFNRRRLVEQYDQADALECGEHAGAVGLGIQRPIRPLTEPARRGVAV